MSYEGIVSARASFRQPRQCAAWDIDRVNRYRPGKATLILGGVGCALAFLGIAINYFGNGRIEFAHCVLALGLLAFVVWFSGRADEEE